jgi:2-isopropylmalate synthase
MEQTVVKIYDTTLRDGNQAKGLNLSLQDKLTIAGLLDEFGVHYIEGGWPNPTNPLDTEFYERTLDMDWKHARICAFGSTRRAGVSADQDIGLKHLVDSKAPGITIFGKSWDLHVTEILRCSLEENVKMIEDSVAYLKTHAQEVVYDAEHFFDGYKANPEYALKTLQAAKNGGADCIVLCETNGGMALPWEVEDVVQTVKKELGCSIGIHTHNDTGVAVANSLAAIRAGAEQVQGTINGYGERCGNANLTVIIPSLQLKMEKPIVTPEQLQGLRSLSLGVSEIANLVDDIRQPYVGETAFSHKGGAHIDGVMKVAHSFEHMNPSLIGNRREFVVSNQSGGSLILDKIKKIKSDATKQDPEVREILSIVKQREEDGYHFEVADGSFELLARHCFGMLPKWFEVLHYRVTESSDGENSENQESLSEATVKVRISSQGEQGGQEELSVAEGNGPVDAMTKALRRSLEPHFPEISKVYLQDYKVRVLENNTGTSSKVRVWIAFKSVEKSIEDTSGTDTSGDTAATWGTIGVSSNIIKASWAAVLDGFTYMLMLHRSKTVQ